MLMMLILALERGRKKQSGIACRWQHKCEHTNSTSHVLVWVAHVTKAEGKKIRDGEQANPHSAGFEYKNREELESLQGLQAIKLKLEKKWPS